MAAPLPEKSIAGDCSVINDDTLYVLSPTSFQALPLKNNATWTTLDMGTSVTSPACVRAVPDGDESQAALYVVGGEADDGGYKGLQRYVFSTKSWETLDPPTTNMQDRTTHGIAYLNDSSSILVYAGSQPSSPSTTSTQTFLISISSPYNIESFTSKAPPVSDPIVLAWNSSAAVMVGGSETNTAIWTFSRDNGWQRLDTNFTSPLSTGTKGALISGDDGSKVLEVYDASVSPNEVTQYVLLDADGKTASNGETVGSSSSNSNSSRKRKRGLSLSDWPTYNSTSAPTTKRSNYSVAQNDDGTLAVVSGGNDDSPLDIFNSTGNTWVSNEVFFGDSSDQVSLTSASASSSASLATSTSSKAASTSSAATASSSGSSGSSDAGKIAGIVLGVLCGIAAVLIIALLLFRRRKQKLAKQKEQMDEKADRMSFQDRGASFMKEAGGSVSSIAPVLPPPNQRFHDSSYDPRSSFAILAGKLGADRFSQRFSKSGNSNANAGLEPPKPLYNNQNNNSNTSLAIISGKYKHHDREKSSFDSTAKLVRSPQSPQSFEDPLELDEMDRQAGGQNPRKPITTQNGQLAPDTVRAVHQVESPDLQNKKRSSGWSRYFANQSDGGVYNPAAQNPSTASLSEYNPSRNPSAVVPPLDVGHLHPTAGSRLSVVPNGRPSFSHSIEDFAARGASLDVAQGQRADFHTGQSLESQGYLNSHDSFSSSRRHSMSSVASNDFFGNETWTPVNAGVAQQVRSSSNSAIKEVHIPPSPALSASQFPRPPSSTYTNDRDSRMPERAVPDSLGRALSPPSAVAIPGPAARAGGGGGGFFPGSGTRGLHDRPSTARKIGPLHPGTLAALRFDPADKKESSRGLGINTDENRDSSATIWPSAGPMTKEEREQAFREKLERDRAEKARKDERKTQMSDMSWVDIGQK